MMKPRITIHYGIRVVRDDLYPGGTKARYLETIEADEIVYASPAEGGAQYALAHVAKMRGIRATIFAADRALPHPRQIQAEALGAKIIRVRPGYMNVVRARAREYAESCGAHYLPFGVNTQSAVNCIMVAAIKGTFPFIPDEIWCAAGSGTLARAMAAAWPEAEQHVVQVGRQLHESDVPGATIHVHPLKFGQACKSRPPFPSDQFYDAKAWEICLRHHKSKRTLFWNVTGPAPA